MNKIYIPQGYVPPLNIYDMQKAIEFIKNEFQIRLRQNLHLKRVSAPLFVSEQSGLNDNLSGVERPVSFDVPAVGEEAQVVHSLAKWKRLALKRYQFEVGKGLYADMNAIRRDEDLDNLHSIYVDQWDWERMIRPEERNIEFLKQTVQRIVCAVCDTLETVKVAFPAITVDLERNVTFITAQELEDRYPGMSDKEKEYLITKEYKTVFLMQIGGNLSNGKPHDHRAPDYDDWELNGDILFYNEVLDCAFEISSMGIRVNEESLARQLKLANCEERRELPFHKMLLNGELPLTMGGGIGQSRLCMLMLGVAHIGEVQASIWDEATHKACEEAGIVLL